MEGTDGFLSVGLDTAPADLTGRTGPTCLTPTSGGRRRRLDLLLDQQLELERRLSDLHERRQELRRRADQEVLTPQQRLDEVRRRNAAIRKRAEDMESRARLASMNPIFFHLDGMKRDFLTWAYIQTGRHREKHRNT